MKAYEFLKNVHLGAAAAWVVVWNIVCGIGLYYDGTGPIETLPGALSMVASGAFAFGSTLFALLSPAGQRLVTAPYGDFSKVRPALKLLSVIGALLLLSGVYTVVTIVSGQP
jgi:hypothetical protein